MEVLAVMVLLIQQLLLSPVVFMAVAVEAAYLSTMQLPVRLGPLVLLVLLLFLGKGLG